MFLTSPTQPLAAYLQLAALKADTTLDLTDRNGVAIPDGVLSSWLEEHSGEINSLVGQSWLPQEETLTVHGEGSTYLRVPRAPIIYVRQAKIVLPNSRGFDIPIQSLLIDQWTGTLENMTPLTFQGIGVTSLFPLGTPIAITVASGIGWAIPPPTFTATAIVGGSLPFTGSHAVTVTSVTVSGESLAGVPQTVTMPAGGGSIAVTITSNPGAIKYYVYVDGLWVAELQGYAIGAGTVALTFDATPSTSTLSINFDGTRRALPTVDTSAIPYQGRYAALPRLVKLLIQTTSWEQKNPSNQGISRMSTGPKNVGFKDNVRSTLAARIDALYDSLQFQGIA